MHHLLFNFESIAKFMKNSMDLQLHYLIWKMLKAYYMWGKKPPANQKLFCITPP